MKTSELTGAQLDFWVAKALGWKEVPHPEHPKQVGLTCWQFGPHVQSNWVKKEQYRPSTDWGHAGPIIEREQISIGYSDQGSRERGGWTAFVHEVDGLEFDFDSPLVAAMRAFVASKFGQEVPDSTG